jgi:branched-chain amino acid transport system substrate-binding protein
MRSYIASKSVAVSYEITFNRGQNSYLPELTSLIDSQADCVILVANAHEGNIIIPELFGLKKELPIISHWGILGGDFARRNKNILGELDLTFFQTFLFKESNRPQAKDLENKYREEYGLAENAEIYSQHAVAQAYDSLQLLASAAQKANSSNRADIIEALEDAISYEGVIKDYKPAFTNERHDGLGLSDFRMARFNIDGQIVPVQKGSL